MASILSKHTMGDTKQPDRYLSRLAARYKALVAPLRERFLRNSSSEKAETLSAKGSVYMFQEPEKTEEESLSEQQFSVEEIVCLVKLREHYQNGGSDRASVIRHLAFLRYLRSRDRISS